MLICSCHSIWLRVQIYPVLVSLVPLKQVVCDCIATIVNGTSFRPLHNHFLWENIFNKNHWFNYLRYWICNYLLIRASSFSHTVLGANFISLSLTWFKYCPRGKSMRMRSCFYCRGRIWNKSFPFNRSIPLIFVPINIIKDNRVSSCVCFERYIRPLDLNRAWIYWYLTHWTHIYRNLICLNCNFLTSSFPYSILSTNLVYLIWVCLKNISSCQSMRVGSCKCCGSRIFDQCRPICICIT